jgi:hypothetical protein
LLIYDSDHTDAQKLLDDFNTVHPKLRFTAKTESDKKINYLYITIHKTPRGWKTSIYRKPTFTDTIIPFSSNPPPQHKYAAVSFLYNRLNTYNLQEHEYRSEEDTIHSIMHNNDFHTHPRNPLSPDLPPPQPPIPRLTTPTSDGHQSSNTQKWATFTYIGKETTFITNLF